MRFIIFVSSILLLWTSTTYAQNNRWGMKGQQAPKWQIEHWLDKDGTPTQLELCDYEGKVLVMFTFQSWCPGCHSRGFPTLKKLVDKFGDDDAVGIVAIQTVFEGHRINTVDKVRETQQKYQLFIPFAHDPGNESTRHRSTILTDYKTGGTPWFIIIDKKGKIIFNDFHIAPEKAINLINKLVDN